MMRGLRLPVLLVFSFSLVPMFGARNALAIPYCDPGWRFTAIRVEDSTKIAQVGSNYANYNGTRHPMTMTLEASKNGTVTHQASVSVSGSVKAFIFAEVKTEVGFSVSKSITTGQKNTVTITVDKKRFGNGEYGVWRAVTSGHLFYMRSNCSKIDKGRVTYKVPRFEGWCTWQSKDRGANEPAKCL